MILEDDLHLAEFCRSAHPRLVALARFLTKGSQVDAEDLTQDTLHAFVDKWKNGMIVADPQKYADGILRNLAKRALQKNSELRLRQVPLEEAEDPSTPDVASTVEDQAKYELLHHAVSGVQNRRQRNFLTWALDGASIPEIADREFKESGRRSSAHQVSCALDRGRGQLSASYKKRGGWRVILPPMPLLGDLKRKMAEIGRPVIEVTQSATFAVFVNTIVVALLTFPGGSSGQTPAFVEREMSHKGTSAVKGLVARLVPVVIEGQTTAPQIQRTAQLPSSQVETGPETTQVDVWKQPAGGPSGPEAWLADVVGHPERLLPQCGGLPVCGSP